MSVSTSDIQAVLNGIDGIIEQESVEAYRSVANTQIVEKAVACAKAGDQEGFFINLIYPFEKVVDGILGDVTISNEAKFILSHGNFVEHHFQVLFEKHEGSAYCADKSRTIIRSLLRFYMADEKIKYDYNQKYTYHLPKKIFTTHEEIVEFYQSLYHLYYGKPEAYLSALASVVSRAGAESE